MMKALIYARQSSGKDDFSESVEAQIANCKKLAAKEKLEVIGVYKDLNTSGETYPVGAEEIARLDKAYMKWALNQSSKKDFRLGLCQVLQKLSEVDFVRNYLDQLKKDVKYYMGQDFTYDPQYLTILDAYKEFLKENKGFVNAKTTDDIVIPQSFKTPDEEELDEIFNKIYEVNDTGRLKELLPLVTKVI